MSREQRAEGREQLVSFLACLARQSLCLGIAGGQLLRFLEFNRKAVLRFDLCRRRCGNRLCLW